MQFEAAVLLLPLYFVWLQTFLSISFSRVSSFVHVCLVTITSVQWPCWLTPRPSEWTTRFLRKLNVTRDMFSFLLQWSDGWKLARQEKICKLSGLSPGNNARIYMHEHYLRRVCMTSDLNAGIVLRALKYNNIYFSVWAGGWWWRRQLHYKKRRERKSLCRFETRRKDNTRTWMVQL